MTENLAAPAREDIAPSILAPKRRLTVSVWVLVLSVLLALVAGWGLAQVTQTITSSSCACSEIAAPTGTATPTPSETEDTEDDSVFVDLATRDIDDFAKDLGDMKTTVDEGGFWRLLSNSVELNFNATQLRDHEVPRSITTDWNKALDALDEDVDSIEAGVTKQSDQQVIAGIADARQTVDELREIVSGVD